MKSALSDSVVRSSARDGPRLSALVSKIASDIDRVLGAGDLADLRRLRPDDVARPAFWWLVATRLEPAGALPEGGERRDEVERQWAVVLAAMATMQGLHRPDSRLGRALALANLAEMRLLRLLRARGDILADTVRVTVHQLAQQAQPVDMADIARLVLSDGRSNEDAVRRQVARDYYGAIHQIAKETNP